MYSEEPEDETHKGEPKPLLAGRVKKITGRTHIECRGNYKDSGSMLPMFDPHFVANEVPQLRKEPATMRRIFVRTFNKYFKDIRIASNKREYEEFRRKDPRVNHAPAQWRAFDLDKKVKSAGWGMALIHVLLEAFQEHKDYLIGKKQIQNSWDHPLFPPEWKECKEEYFQQFWLIMQYNLADRFTGSFTGDTRA